MNRGLWMSLETRTEAAYVRQALAGQWPGTPDPAPGELALVCRPESVRHLWLDRAMRLGMDPVP